MTIRRKTWLGVGLFTLAGTAVASLPPGTGMAATQGALRFADFGSVPAAATLPEGWLRVAQASGGGEGGEEGAVPESYALPPAAGSFTYAAIDEIAAYARGVHASYRAAADAAQALQAAVDALLAKPDATTLAAARAAWVKARPAYLVTEAFRFYDGPIEAVEGALNAWPVNEAFIDYVEGKPYAGIINDPTIDMTLRTLILRNQVSDEADVTLGWHAIEFLLWGQDRSATGPGDRPASDYVSGQGNNDRRRAYLKDATGRLAADIDRLGQAWAPGAAGNYASTFLALETREAVGRIFNGMAVLAGFELMSDRLAVGLDSGDQEDEHSCFSDTTHQDFVFDLKGIETVWTGRYPGAAGPGMRDLVMRIDPGLAAEVDRLVADATAKVAALGDPWDRVLASAPGSDGRLKGEAAVSALGSLAQGLKRAGTKLGVQVQIPSG